MTANWESLHLPHRVVVGKIINILERVLSICCMCGVWKLCVAQTCRLPAHGVGDEIQVPVTVCDLILLGPQLCSLLLDCVCDWYWSLSSALKNTKTLCVWVWVCECCVCCFIPLSMFDLSHWATVRCAANSPPLSHHCGFFCSKMSPRPSTSHLCLYRWPRLHGPVLIPRWLLSHVINHPYMIIVHLLWSNFDVLYS